MNRINYDNRVFVPRDVTANGEVNGETRFYYRQQDDVVWATYNGGNIKFGTLIAIVNANDELNMRYSQINQAGEMQTGVCRSTPEVLPDGRVRLHEEWQWTSGDCSSGTSIVEELK